MADPALHFHLDPVDNTRLASLCGINDGNIKELGRRFDVHIQRRGSHFRISGPDSSASRAELAIRDIYAKADHASAPVDLPAATPPATAAPPAPASAGTGTTVAGISTRNATQASYVGAIRSHVITFGIGASGTGKTFLAMACALDALSRHEVARVVLVRPAVATGEDLGFLPGDLEQKIHPYLRPLQDALREIRRGGNIHTLQDSGRLELVPLGFLRGRTLADCFVILDEAQNATRAQMRMFLTRLGRDSRCVITGDETQVDLPEPRDSGLADILARTASIEGCAVTRFHQRDSMRHPIVRRILDLYEDG